MIRVLIVDDSDTARQALRLALESDSELCVVGEASDGDSALAKIQELGPDIVTMDVYLRRENGIDVVAEIMEHCPCPVLMVTAADLHHGEVSYAATLAGALDVMPKLPAPTHPAYADRSRMLIRLVKALAAVPVVHIRRRPKSDRKQLYDRPLSGLLRRWGNVRALAIGASTGGPPVVSTLLASVGTPMRLPVLLVQHISPGFIAGFAAWLAGTAGHAVRVVDGPEQLLPDTVYIPTEDRHLVLQNPDTVATTLDAPVAFNRPSVDVLFNSVATHLGTNAVGVLCTGMGKDGAEGLAALRQAGAYTIVQSPDTCAVGGMPQSAINLGAAEQVMSPSAIGRFLHEHFGPRS
jgi:two-component system chemotaxis response regulator CheB